MKKLFFIVCFIVAFSLVSCDSDDEDEINENAVCFLASDKIVVWNENVTVSFHNMGENFKNIRWSINGIPQTESNSVFTFASGDKNQTFNIEGSVTFNNGNTVKKNILIYNSCYPELTNECLKFINKHNIKTAISICVKNPELNFTFNSGKISISQDKYCSNETNFYYYSITKTFISAMILNLVEDGKLNLTDKISDILDVDTLNQDKINVNATIEQLLTHRSGIYDFVDNYNMLLNNPFFTKEWNPILILDLINKNFKQGNEFIYASSNYVLLGMIIEKICDDNLNDILRDNFFVPLNLTSLKLVPQDDYDKNFMSHPHVLPNTIFGFGKGNEPLDITQMFGSDVLDIIGKTCWASGGLLGSIQDCASWIYELFSDKGVAVSQNVRNLIFDSTKDCSFNTTEAESFGLCGRRIFYNDTFFTGSYGRSLGSNNLAFYLPEKDTVFVILTSSNADAMGNPDVYDLMALLYDKMD